MSYWEDRRDELDKLYPSCNSFVKFHEKYNRGLVESIRCGVVFLYAPWSGPALSRFKFSCYALEDSVPWERFSFDVVNVDGLGSGEPFTREEALGGYGEVFWVSSGKIIESMGREWSKEIFSLNTQRLIEDHG